MHALIIPLRAHAKGKLVMFGFAKINKHNSLMRRMGSLLGVDFGTAIASSQLDPQDYRAAVLNCTCCKSADACESWMEEHADGAEETPPYCRNAALMEALKG